MKISILSSGRGLLARVGRYCNFSAQYIVSKKPHILQKPVD